MSSAMISKVLNTKICTGNRRLALFAAGDGSGLTSVSSIAEWSGLDVVEAADLAAEMIAEGWFIPDAGGRLICPWLQEDDRHIPAPPRQPSLSRTLRHKVFARDGHACQYCTSTQNLTVDHKVPRSRGGSDEMGNLITACKRCNCSKGTLTYEDFMAARATP